MQLHRCFECFVVRNHVNHQVNTSYEVSRMKNWRSRVLRRLFKTIQSEENSLQVPRSFLKEEQSKMGRKCKKSHLRGCLRHHAPVPIYAPLRLGQHSLLPQAPCDLHCYRVKIHFFQVGSVDNAQFSSPNPLSSTML